MIRQACTQAASWRNGAFAPKVAVNVSAAQGQSARAPPRCCKRSSNGRRWRPDRLELELTEHAIIDVGSEATIASLRRVADLGVQLAIDDFGPSGFSSFAYLRHLPVHTIKIDSSFIGQIGQNRNDEIIIKAMIELSHALGKRVVAEGVETGSSSSLREQGCDEAQGFLLSPPVEAAR